MVPCLGFASWVEANNSQHSSKQFVGQTELACCPRPSTGDKLLSPFQHSPENPLVPFTWPVSTTLFFVIIYYFYECGSLSCI